MDDLMEFAVAKIYRKAALRDTGSLARGIEAVQTGRLAFQIKVRAEDPESGFNYAPVTRFGHETHLITPRQDSVMTVSVLHWFTKGDIGPKGHRFEGEEVFRPWSRGFHPPKDWAERGHGAVQEATRRTGKLIARDISQELS
jgi:hypothetical protein